MTHHNGKVDQKLNFAKKMENQNFGQKIENFVNDKTLPYLAKKTKY